jgi:septal ring factor EnvC (AmiA/AmiB activator)
MDSDLKHEIDARIEKIAELKAFLDELKAEEQIYLAEHQELLNQTPQFTASQTDPSFYAGKLATAQRTKANRQKEIEQLAKRYRLQIQGLKDALKSKRKSDAAQQETIIWRYKFWRRQQEEEEEMSDGPYKIRPPVRRPDKKKPFGRRKAVRVDDV